MARGWRGNLLNTILGTLGQRGGSVLAEEVGEEFGLDDARLEATGDLHDASLVVVARRPAPMS